MKLINIGENIRLQRIQCRLSQQELAKRCHISASTISLLEKGIHMPTLRSISRISKQLNVPLDYLLKDSDKCFLVFSIDYYGRRMRQDGIQAFTQY